MATPLIEDVHRHWPHATLTAMCQEPLGAVLTGNPYVQEIFSFTRLNEFLRRQEARHLIARLRQGKYDLGILMPNSFSSAWWLWRGEVANRLGYATDMRRFLLTHPVPTPPTTPKEHLVVRYKHLLEPLGIPLSATPPRLYLLPEEIQAAQTLLRQFHVPQGVPLLGVNAVAAFGSAKCWPRERFRALTEQLLAQTDAYIVYFADAAHAATVHTICQGLSERVVNLAGLTSLRMLFALIGQCTLMLTNDSGPMHAAAALGIPLVALFGSTDPDVTGPYPHGEIIRKKDIPCAPCLKRVCPIDFRCMKRIAVEEVCHAILAKLHAQASAKL